MKYCKAITTLPDSIERLSRLRVLDLRFCESLQKLPSSIGQITALQEPNLSGCGSLKALPDMITALSGLQQLYVNPCSSISKLPTILGVMTGLTDLGVFLATEWQAVGSGQVNALKTLTVMNFTDEVVSVLDRSGTLRNLDQLFALNFTECWSMTKLPESMRLLTSLDVLILDSCDKLQELPNSIGQLKVLRRLSVSDCSSLETLPDSLGELTSLQHLCVMQCPVINKLPTSIGRLSSLWDLRIEFCGGLQSLPADSFRHLNALRSLTIRGCGSMAGLGLLRSLQCLRIWGCTSITKLPGSCLMVVHSNFNDPGLFWAMDGWLLGWVPQNLKQMQVVEANDCGLLCHVQNTETGQLILQRVYKLPCFKPKGLTHLNKYVATE